MDPRYTNPDIAKIFSTENKLQLWQKTELAVIQAREQLGRIDKGIYETIKEKWEAHPIDIEWWEQRDKEIHHDLNAFVDERLRHIKSSLHQYVHDGITSYDTEEPAFVRMLDEAFLIIRPMCEEFYQILEEKAIKYRYTIMMARTHGQFAELQSFGSRCLNWLNDFRQAYDGLVNSSDVLIYSKISGAIGKYTSIDPSLEELALANLGLEQFYNATQIMPRIMYAPFAQALANMVIMIDKIANDIRLTSRSGLPLTQEPFGKKQKGSSAMPQKKNPIRTEQLGGMARMAKGYMNMITDNIKTDEERAIEQSCVERVAWPDLFHVVVRSLQVISDVISGLQVYPDNMIQEIHESRGTYASSVAKEFLKKKLSEKLKHEDVYRIVQLASFNVFELDSERFEIRATVAGSFQVVERLMTSFSQLPSVKVVSIKDFIPEARLRVSSELGITGEQVNQYNECLKSLFTDIDVLTEWKELFNPVFLLRNEKFIYENTIA